MKKKLILIMGAVAFLALSSAAFAQPINNDENNNATMYVPTVSLTGLTQDNFTGTVGGVFYTPYYFNTTLNYLGYADPTDAPLVDSHTVTIWTDGTENIVAQAVVPAGTPTLWANGYAWVQLSSAVTLTYQHYYAIGASVVSGVDSWGNLISNTSGTQDTGSGGEITWNVSPNGYGPSGSGNQHNGPFVQAGTGYEFAKVGAYTPGATDPDDSSTGGARASITDSIYSAPNMGYNITSVPEPTSLAFVGVGAAMLLGLLKRTR
ncbi:MAG TPA: hypothetical protein VN784_03140 [Candidatus Limnocylindrales bacterium]|nr:hypothetical protein [Candidatus Limnocylindrales bacterium]